MSKEAIMPTVSIDPFKLAEWFGWGYGIFKQAIFRLPAGSSVTLTLSVPDDEVWWVTYTIIGDIPSSSANVQFDLFSEERTVFEHHPTINAHEGWIGQPFCPPGWHRCSGKSGIRGVMTNVTGDTTYNDLPSQEVFVHYTFLMFKVKKDKVKLIDRLLDKMLEAMSK